MRDSVKLKSRLLTTAFVLPLSVSMALAPAWGFELKTDTDDTDYPTYEASVKTSDNQPDGDSIIIEGSPTGTGNAALLIDDGTAVVLDGIIRIRDYDDEDVNTPITDGIGLDIASDVTDAAGIRLKDGGDIFIIEVRGPEYDGDDDGNLPDANDDDEDGIIEGPPALEGDNTRIGIRLQLNNTLTGPLIGESGSRIEIEGNAANIGDVVGVKIDGNLASNLDLSTAINMFGDNSRGVDIDNTIGGYYRQRGNVDVRGEGGVGIDIGNAVSGALIIEGGINATGYSTIPAGSPGGPARGGADSSDDDFDEFSDRQRAANEAERRQSRAAVEVSDTGRVNQGIIINGPVNRSITDDEQEELDTISERRTDDDDTNDNVVALKTDPYHYDENRPSLDFRRATFSEARLTSYGESEATLLIRGDVGTGSGATKETLLDTRDDDDEDTAARETDEADIYNGGGEFFYSHGLMVRNWIEADGLYDSVNNGEGYVIDRPATAVKLDNGATIHGGIYNSGIISALAYNADATAIDLLDGTLTTSWRNNEEVLLNEGTIQSLIASYEKSYADIQADSKTATAVKIGSNAVFHDRLGASLSAPVFVNAGDVIARSSHYELNATTSTAGANAVAFDISAYAGNFNLEQRMRQADTTLSANVDGNADNETVYSGGGDTDIDDNDDGVIDTRDVNAPRIIGDIKFGAGENTFAIKAGTVTGDISFGAGDDALNLSNEIAEDNNDTPDDKSDDWLAPITSFRGRITNSDTLNVTIGDRAELHFDGQEGDADAETEGLGVSTLKVSGELGFSVDENQLSSNASVLNVRCLVEGACVSDFADDPENGNDQIDEGEVRLSDNARIVPRLVGLTASDTASTTVKLIEYDTLTINNEIDHYLSDETPFIYGVELIDDDENSVISATFTTKNATQIGLENPTEIAAYNAVLEHFRANEELEMAVVDITDKEDFAAAYRQLFPHYSDGTAQQLSGLADMATGAVSQHLQLVNAGGRRGGDGWLQQFGDYRRQDSSANGHTVSGNSYAIALGYDLPVSVIDALGLYMQMGFTAVNEKSTSRNEVTSESFTYGAYLSDKIGPLRYQLNAAYGLVDLESSRFANFNGVADSLTADWDATSTSASARIAYPILEDGHLLRLEAGMDYFRLEHDDYRETDLMDNALAMHVAGGESDKTSQFIGLRGGYRTAEDEGSRGVAIKWEPNYYLGWRSTSDFTPYEATANFVGTDSAAGSFKLKSHIEPEDAIDIGLGLAAHNDYFAFEFNYRARFADDEETHGGGISIRLLF
jgi:uncharacterized protein with beta-barrel porin domain